MSSLAWCEWEGGYRTLHSIPPCGLPLREPDQNKGITDSLATGVSLEEENSDAPRIGGHVGEYPE
jgi:hypothetical protein